MGLRLRREPRHANPFARTSGWWFAGSTWNLHDLPSPSIMRRRLAYAVARIGSDIHVIGYTEAANNLRGLCELGACGTLRGYRGDLPRTFAGALRTGWSRCLHGYVALAAGACPPAFRALLFGGGPIDVTLVFDG